MCFFPVHGIEPCSVHDDESEEGYGSLVTCSSCKIETSKEMLCNENGDFPIEILEEIPVELDQNEDDPGVSNKMPKKIRLLKKFINYKNKILKS
jgi:hypothetical protein